MVDERSLVLFEGADDALESRGDVCEVGDTTTNDENLALRVRGATGHQIDWKNVRFFFSRRTYSGRTNGFCILVSLSLSWSTGVLAIVGEFMGKTMSSDSVGVDDGSATTSDHGPDAALGIENGKLERGTSRTIQFLYVRFFPG